MCVCNDMVWHSMAWYVMLWHGMVCYVMLHIRRYTSFRILPIMLFFGCDVRPDDISPVAPKLEEAQREKNW